MLKTVAGTVTATAAVRARARGVDGIGNDMGEWWVLVNEDVFMGVNQPQESREGACETWAVTRPDQSR